MTTTARQRTGEQAGRARPFAAALALAVLYGALRIYWQLDGPPCDLSPCRGDLVVFSGWSAIGLCAVAALTAGALAGVGSPAVSVTLLVSSAMSLLDVVGGVLPGLGIRFYPWGALSRAAGVATGVLLILATLASRWETATGGPTGASATPSTRTPRWAYWAAYLSVAGCLGRIAAQAVVGFDETPMGVAPR